MTAMKEAYRLYALTVAPEAAGKWLQEHFDFVCHWEEQALIAQNEGLTISFTKGDGCPSVYGIHHLALNATDIHQALAICQKQGLNLDTDNGRPYFNPGVWGTGTHFFNIHTPFGLRLEICQRLDVQQGNPSRVISGLEHLGVFVRDIEKAEAFFISLGFRHAYPRTRIEKDGCQIFCSMMTDDVLMLEVFSLQGENLPMENVYSGISRVGILWERNASFVGPDGENIKLMTKL